MKLARDVTKREPATADRDDERAARATVRLAGLIETELSTNDDPTEVYHEASRIYPGVVDPFVTGASRLERSLPLRLSATRSVKRHAHLPFTALRAADPGPMSLTDALGARRSRRTYGAGPLSVDDLSALLHASYGINGSVAGTPQLLRTAPSGGALYPLELYVACQQISGLGRGLYHYDPPRHGLELIRPLAAGAGRGLTPYDELLERSAAFVVVTAMLWRSRFKYGQRAYRFALLEAGHVAQSFLLAAEARRLAATPVGGFFDRLVDEFLGVDGLYEASLYLLPVGRAAP